MEFRLKQLRQEKHISQIKLAIDLNMNQNSISRYENMEREADYATLILIADYFNVSLDYLLGRTEKKKTPFDKWCLLFANEKSLGICNDLENFNISDEIDINSLLLSPDRK